MCVCGQDVSGKGDGKANEGHVENFDYNITEIHTSSRRQGEIHAVCGATAVTFLSLSF